MSDLQSIIAAGWVILFGALIGEVISMPLLGALVRWRVHYDPDRVRLGDSERPKTEPGPLVTGYFSTVRRVYRLEGWAGLYKGFWPSVFNTLVPLLVALPFLDGDMNLEIGRQARFGDYGVVGPVLQVVTGLVIGIPMHVFTTRAIVTPYKLRSSRPLVSYRLLLSPIERRQPWKIYILPGLFVSQFANLLLGVFLIPAMATWLGQFVERQRTPALATVLVIGFVLLGPCLQTLFQVSLSRFAVQKTQSAEEDDNSVETAADIAAAARVESYSEDVIALRDDHPYLNFADYVSKVTAEEGWRVLLRAWWVSFLPFPLWVLAYMG
ncbi:hypothetical protein PM082_018021 [Marasmius tenuissimus]|nr:hypothetical protein PM082_018021 [Marasmius tenuissimus]